MVSSPLIPARTRAFMRRRRANTLVDSCAVQVRTQVDVPGGVQETWVTALTLPCRLEQPTIADNERFAAGQLTAKPDAVVAFAPGTELETTSRLIVTGTTETVAGDVAWSRTLEIVGDTGPSSVTVERRYPARDL